MFNEKIINSIIKSEYNKIEDFSYFVENYINRIDPCVGVSTDFTLYDHQREISNHIDVIKGLLVIGKPRQCGISSTIIWKIVQYVLLGNKKAIGLIAPSRGMIDFYMVEIIRLLNNISTIKKYNSHKIECNGVEIFFGTPNINFFSGNQFDLIVLDEFSFYGNEELFRKAICNMNMYSNLVMTTGKYDRRTIAGEILERASRNGKLYYNWYDINSDKYILNAVKMRKILGKDKFEMEYEMGD